MSDKTDVFVMPLKNPTRQRIEKGRIITERVSSRGSAGARPAELRGDPEAVPKAAALQTARCRLQSTRQGPQPSCFFRAAIQEFQDSHF